MTQQIAVAGPKMEPIRERLGWRAASEEFEAIRRLWINHSKAEDARDIPGLLSTLADDCVYALWETGDRWEGHEGAHRFYTELLTGFPDIKFDLQDIVVGPQGVFEVADVTGTFSADWIGLQPDHQPKAWRTVIFFPWDRERRLFRGELVYRTPDLPGIKRRSD
jgi:ketosteroid isomerase-like protein